MFKKEHLVFLLPCLYIITMTAWIFLSELIFIQVPDSIKIPVEISSRILVVVLNGLILYKICQKYKLVFAKERESNDTLLTIMNNVPEFIVLKDEQNKWVEANDFALSFTKQTRTTFEGKKDQEIFQKQTSCDQTDQQMWETNEIFKGEEVLLNEKGESVIFDVIKVPLFYKNGKKKGSIVIGRDISEKKAKEKVIQRTDKLNVVGALAAGIVHEIKNPLTTIQGFIQLMKEQNKEKSYEAYYELLLEEIKKIDFIIEQFLILSKTDDMNKPKMNNINHLMQELVSFYQNEKNEENLHIDLKINGPLPSLFCQENQLKQAVLNLLENAKEATKEKKTPIALRAWFEPKKNEINIVIHDEGKGISPERLEKIGEPFFTTKEKGIGLGTTIAYKIIEQHKGSIQYESEIGKGTKVHVRLPCN